MGLDALERQIMKCPNCKLENPPAALICDCGYNFETGLAPKLSRVRAGLKIKLLWIFSPLILGLLAPSVILFCIEVFVGRIGSLAALSDIAKRQFAPGHNLFTVALLALIPFGVLSAVCGAAARRTSAVRLSCLGICGLLGILCLMVPGHAGIWYPLYAGGDTSSTAVVGFIFIPIFCLFTLGIGLLVGWLVSSPPFFQRQR